MYLEEDKAKAQVESNMLVSQNVYNNYTLLLSSNVKETYKIFGPFLDSLSKVIADYNSTFIFIFCNLESAEFRVNPSSSEILHTPFFKNVNL